MPVGPTEWLRMIVDLWRSQIKRCEERKEKEFGRIAKHCWGYLGKSYVDLTLEDEGRTTNLPHDLGEHYPRLNKSREFVSVFMPYIHEQIPHRTVTPRVPPLPPQLQQFAPNAGPKLDDQLLAWMLEHWLNYIPTEYGLYKETKVAIPEALVKGRAVVWHEMIDSPYGEIPASNFDTVDGLLIDADAMQTRDAGFIMRRRVRSVWQVEDEFGIPAKELRSAATYRSNASRSYDKYSLNPKELDIVVYYEVWSRMGIGHRLEGASDKLDDMKLALNSLGPQIFLVILPGMDYPLNVPPEKLTADTEGEEALRRRLEWPIAFYEDASNPWPCSFLDFHPNSGDPWATSPLEGGLPLLIYLDAIYTYIMARAKATCRDLIFTAKELAENVQAAIEGGNDQTVVPVDLDAKTLEQLVYILNFPPANQDIWTTLQVTERKFEQATGMDPLIYGGGGSMDNQMRSAAEAHIREGHLNSRPDDYTDAVIEWMSQIARKEAQATRLLVPASAGPSALFGEEILEMETPEQLAVAQNKTPLSFSWNTLVNTDDPAIAAADMDYTCEAGSGTRKNKQKQQADLALLMQTLIPPYMERAMRGDAGPHNTLMEIMAETTELPLTRLALPNGVLPPEPVPEQVPAEGAE